MSMEILSASPDTAIVSTRVVNYTRELVFKAWADPAYLADWWGPAGFTNSFHEFNFEVGGKWRFTMHGPEKGNYENECEFIKIVPPHLIAWNRVSKPIFQVVASFESLGPEQTRVSFQMLFHSAAEANKLRNFVPEKNEENFDKLEKVLEQMAGNDSKV